MPKYIPISVYNISKSFKNFDKKKKYSISIQIDFKTYYFSSKKKADKFAFSFSKKLTKLLSSVLLLSSSINQYFVSFIPSLCYKDSLSFNKSFSYINETYLNLLNGVNTKHIFSHVFSILDSLETTIISFRNNLRSNNRYSFLYSSICSSYDSFKLLKFRIVSHMNSVSSSTSSYCSILKAV